MTRDVPPEVEAAVGRLVEVYREQRNLLRLLLVIATQEELTVVDPASPDLLLAVLPVDMIRRVEEVMAAEL